MSQRSVEALTGADATRPVQITMTPAFAMSWLMPRITEFQHLHPGVAPEAQIKITHMPGNMIMEVVRRGRGACLRRVPGRDTG